MLVASNVHFQVNSQTAKLWFYWLHGLELSLAGRHMAYQQPPCSPRGLHSPFTNTSIPCQLSSLCFRVLLHLGPDLVDEVDAADLPGGLPLLIINTVTLPALFRAVISLKLLKNTINLLFIKFQCFVNFCRFQSRAEHNIHSCPNCLF